MESIWIVGDTFVASSYEKTLHMDSVQKKLYMRDKYDVFAFLNNSHFDTNFLSRLRNVLVTAFNQNDKLPRIILIVLDNDLLRFINHRKFGVQLESATLQEWLLQEVNQVVNQRFAQLPNKCIKPGFPHVVWFGLPLHDVFIDNDLRIKFNHGFECEVLKFKNMSLLLPKKGWNAKDKTVILNGNYTPNGAAMYWLAIDVAIHFWDTKKQVQIIQKTKNTTEIEETKTVKFQAGYSKGITHQDDQRKIARTFSTRGGRRFEKVRTFFHRNKKDDFCKFDRSFNARDKFHWYPNDHSKLLTPQPYAKFKH